jgi:hypothetical protein
MYLISTEQAQDYVRRFEAKTLPKHEWTHEAHLMIGLHMVVTHGKNALPEMRQKLRAYNDAVGTINSETMGYHETLTVFWLWTLRQFCHDTHRWTLDEVTVDLLLFNETLANRNLFLQYYSKDLILSTEARKNFVLPDLKEMNGVDYFLV